ncbi:MAG: helix-turn-helix domain-containing protein [Bryobacteraceae bacterium]
MTEARVYTREFRMEVVRRILAGESVPRLSQELGIHRKLLYQWLRQVNEGGEANLRPRGRPRKGSEAEQAESRQLGRTMARQQLMIDFLLLVSREVQGGNYSAWREAVYRAIEATLAEKRGLSVELMCELMGIARCSYYRHLRKRANGK